MNPEIQRICWCGNSHLAEFSSEYLRCASCGTLVSQSGLKNEQTLVSNDDQDFYGKNYWLGHQVNDLSLPDIYERARQDISARCLHWLSAVLSYKLPPAKVLELGSGHGAFLALLNWSGFDVTGLELSPWVANFARMNFDVSMLVGILEHQNLKPTSYDIIILNDVLEHLPHPSITIQHCASLLKEDGVIVVQTPNYSSEKSYDSLVSENSSFLTQLEPVEHLYIFNHASVRQLFQSVGCCFIEFEPAAFGDDYDMFFMAGKNDFQKHDEKQISASLSSTSKGRMIQALLDLGSYCKQMQAHIEKTNKDISEFQEKIDELHLILKSKTDEIAVLQSSINQESSPTPCKEKSWRWWT